MKKLVIQKGFYFSAGRQYNWVKDGIDPVGVGVERRWFTDDELLIEVDNIEYVCNTKQALEFINKYKSFEIRKGLKIGYIPKSLLVKVEKKEQTLF